MYKEIDYKALNIDPDILAKAWDGDTASQLLLGKAYFKAVYTDDNCSHAFKWIRRSAEQGNMEAQYRLGDLLALGQGTCKSYTDAYGWYTKSALQGYKKALIRIFNIYQQDKKMHCRGKLNSGENKCTDYKFEKESNIRELNEYRLKRHESKLNHAISYYTNLFNVLKSRNKEDPETSFKLGFLYQYGYGVKKCVKLAIDYYTEAAEQGNRDAQYHLGYLYENGTEIKFNYRLALKWYHVSATSGNIAAQNALGYFYEKGLATELNFEGAIYWYTKAANAGNSDAQLTLGKLYRKGEGVEVYIFQAIKWYTLAASQGNGAAQNCLNQLSQNGEIAQLSGIKKNTGYVGEHQTKPTLHSKLQDDIEKMNNLPHINQLKKLAEHALRTDGNAMFTLGMKYYNGEDFTQDKDTGFQWIKKAAKTGLQKAEMKVAGMYYNGGDVVDQDYHESSIWTAKLVKKKNSVGQCDLGLLYLSGEGVRNDPLEASKWFTKSADQGNAEAQYQFGLLRLEGLGLRKETEEALEWLNKSALSGNTNALYTLAEFYQTGEYLEKDVYRAIKLYEYSAKNGNWDSHIRLAEIYEKGELVDQNLQKAESYYELTANSLGEYQRYQLALKYMNGAFGYSDYVKAFELFKQIADETLYSGYNIFQEPISNRSYDMNYIRMLDMLILVSKRGGQEACYYIGHFNENGITTFWDETLLHPNYTEAIHWYLIAATNGDSRAKYRLGAMHEEGKGVDVDLAVAHNYYLEAYGSGNEGAAFRLALMYMNGEAVTLDMVKAYCLFTEAVNKGYEEATVSLSLTEYSGNLQMLEAVANAGYVAVQYQLGVFYQERRKNDEEALKWLTLASNGGVTDAFYRLGVIHEELKGNNQNYCKAIQLYSEAIKKDHDDAMYRLARIYHLGKGLKRDYQNAYDLYTRAAELGHTESSRVLDINNYSIGQSDSDDGETSLVKYSEDLKDTLLMIEFVAKNGNVYLQHQLGTFYMTNKIHLNHNEAFKWYQMAASSENTDAIYQLGLLHEKGQGTIQNYSMAFDLYTQAKEKEHRDAIYRLGIAYHYGLGVDISTSEAINCYIKAAELGSDESQYKLGKLYECGDLVEKDGLKALEWYTKAYLNGNCDAIKDLYQLYDEEPLESFFFESLFRTFSNIERAYISDEDNIGYSNRQTYGFIYFKLGMMHLNGQGTAKNIAKALKQFLKAYYDYGHQDAKPFISLEYNSQTLILQTTYLDNLNAYLEIKDQIPREHQYNLGMLYYNGVQDVSMSHNISGNPDSALVLEPDHSLAFRYFKLASLNQHPDAQHQLGLMYLRGHGVIKNYQIALKWFTATSESMTPYRCYELGVDFFRGDKVEQDYEIARIYLQKATGAYKSRAQSYLDVIHLNELEKEHRKSNNLEQLEREIKTINPTSLYDRGVALYENSSEGVENHDISSFYIKKAAEKNHKKAIVELAMMYLEGKTFEKDENEAMKWIEKSIKVMNSNERYKQGMIFYNSENYRISLPYMEKGAKENDGYAQTQLGLMYLQGLGVEKNHEQAMKWFEQSTIQLTADICRRKGIEFYESVELDNNYEIALLYLQKAAKENDGHAQYYLGLMYLQGLGVEKNHEQAMKWFEQSTIQLDSDDCVERGKEFYESVELDNNYEIALIYLQKAAKENNAHAQAQLGLMYLQGLGVERNYSIAEEWIKSSVENMDESDYYEYGMKFRNGIEVEKNYTIAIEFLQKAANRRHGPAQAKIGLMYLEGHGFSKNESEGMSWIDKSISNMDQYNLVFFYNIGFHLYSQHESEKHFGIGLLFIKKAAEKDYGLAQALLGEMYLEGKGVQKNQGEALKWSEKSARNLDPRECYDYGMKYYNGFNVEKNYSIAMIYLLAAKRKKYTFALVRIGIIYLEGHGVEVNEEKAMEYFQRSINEMKPENCYHLGIMLYRERRYEISFLYIKNAADAGYGLSQSQLGIMLLEDKATQKNKVQAMEWIEKSMESINPDECYDQGMILYRGTTIIKDYAISFRFMEKAAENNYGLAQAHLALVYLQGFAVEKNKDESIKWVEKSLQYLSPDEYYEQGMNFYNGAEIHPEYEICLLYLRKATEHHHGLAIAQLALMYLEGTGVEKNYGTAMELIQKSMNEMKLDECYRQGMIFYHKTALENNYDIALQYLKRASKANAYAQAQLGYMYRNGIGVDQSHEEADLWFNIVENNYIGESRYCRSKIYHYDQGGMQDFSKAFKLYQEELGFILDDFLFCDYQNKSGTLRGIGLLYEYGDGVTQDFKKAMEYYKRSILDEENLAAYYNIGLLYYYGKGFDQNYKEALLWFEKEADLYRDSQALHVLVEDNTNEASNMNGSSKRKYSLVPDSRIHGEVHYYIGLMHRNGYFVDQDEEKAQKYFKMAHIHGVEFAKNLIK